MNRPRPLTMLTISVFGQGAASAAVNGPGFLIPALHQDGMSLAQAGWVVAASIAGATVALVAWGMVVDRIGETRVMVAALAATAAALVGAAYAADRSFALMLALLFCSGAASAGTASASGRLVVGWFPPHRRGAAMGFRQMAQPLGVGLAALSVPVLADRVGIAPALATLAGGCALGAVACALGLRDPERPELAAGVRPANPYRGEDHLQRIHLASILLVIPQITLWTFQLVWLQVGRGWSPEAAGALVALTQALGGLGRIAAGVISDRMGSRARPLRQIAGAAAVTLLALGISVGLDWAIAVPLIVLASCVTVADNGLAFTAVAERAGPFWSGRALGIQNTGQYLIGTGVPPALGWAITTFGYGPSFGATALFPLLALAVLPRADRHYEDESAIAARPASNLATGTRNGEQDT